MRLNVVILISVVGLTSCVDLNPQPSASEIGLKELRCQGMANPQRLQCLQDIPPEYKKYEEDRRKLLENRAH